MALSKSLFQDGHRLLINSNRILALPLSAIKFGKISQSGRCLGVVLAPEFFVYGQGLLVIGLRLWKALLPGVKHRKIIQCDSGERRSLGAEALLPGSPGASERLIRQLVFTL